MTLALLTWLPPENRPSVINATSTISGSSIQTSGDGTFGGSVVNNGAAGTTRGLKITTAGVTRWWLYGTIATESGTNTGTALALSRYNDSGSYLGDSITITRANGNMTLVSGGGTLTVVGAATFNSTISGSSIQTANLTATATASISAVNMSGVISGSGNYRMVVPVGTNLYAT